MHVKQLLHFSKLAVASSPGHSQFFNGIAKKRKGLIMKGEIK